MRKKLLSLVLIALIFTVGCSDSKTGNDVSAADVVYKIKKKVQIQKSITIIPSNEAEQMLDMKSPEILKKYYGLIYTEIADYMIITNLVNIKSEEIALFKVKDDKNRDIVKKGIQKRIDAKKKESYLPDTIKAVNNATVGESGSFVYLVIWEENMEKKTIISTIKDTTK